MPCKVFDEIIYPFPNFNGFNRWRVDMDKYFHHTRHNGCNYHVNTQSHRQHDKAMFYYSRSNDGFTILCVCLSRIFQNQIWIRETTLRSGFCAWWRHHMETFSALLAICAGNSPVPGEIPAQRPVTWSFDVFFDLRLNKRLRKQSWGWWFETLSRPLWRQCDGIQDGGNDGQVSVETSNIFIDSPSMIWLSKSTEIWCGHIRYIGDDRQ